MKHTLWAATGRAFGMGIATFVFGSLVDTARIVDFNAWGLIGMSFVAAAFTLYNAVRRRHVP